MIFFILLFAIIVILYILSCCTNSEKLKEILAVCALILLCIVSGTRYNTGGSDYFVYKSVYDSMSTNSFIEGIIECHTKSGFEYGFIVYTYLLKIVGFNYYGFTLINSIIFYTIFYLILRKYKYNFNLILILFLYKMFFYNTFISIRQPIAILIFLYSLKYLKDKNILKYYVCCVLALLFHRASIILFFIPIITFFNCSKRKYIIILLICLLLYFVNIDSIINISSILNNIFSGDSSGLNKIDRYISSTNSLSVFYLLEAYLLAVLVLLKYNNIYNYDENAPLFIKLFLCAIPFYTIFARYEIVTRLKDFFFISYPILIYYIANSQKKLKPFVYFFAILISFYGYIRFIWNFDNGSFMQYQSFLFENINLLY